MYLHVQKRASVKLDLFRCLARDRKSPERGNVANVWGKEVDFAGSLFDKQHDFNGISLEVNKIRQSFYLGRIAVLATPLCSHLMRKLLLCQTLVHFLQSMVDIISQHHKDHHLLDMLTEVNKIVIETGIQVPAPSHTLRGQVWL